jgi:hypothetical protein
MREYLIRRTDGEWFDLPESSLSEILRPITVPSKPVPGWGNHRIDVEGVEISFSIEDPGIMIVIEGELPDTTCGRVVEEVLANIEKATGQRGRTVRIT